MRWVTTSMMLEQLREERGDAWEQFVDSFHMPIVRFAVDRGLRREEAEDVAQEALTQFVSAFRLGRYDRERGRLSSWLFGIARNAIAEQRRRRRRNEGDRDFPTQFWADQADRDDSQQVWEAAWQQFVLQRCLERARGEFDLRTVDAFERFGLRGQPADEVAAALEMSRNAVYVAKHRVLKRVLELQREFEEQL